MKQWRVSDVMTTEVVTVRCGTGYKEIADLLVHHGISGVPVLADDGGLVGVVSESDLLSKVERTDRAGAHPLLSRRSRVHQRKATGDTAADLMSSPVVTTGPDATLAAAARRMEAEHVKRLPVVDGVGRLVGVVSRRDLVRVYTRPDEQVRDGVLDLLDALWIDPSEVGITVYNGVVELTGELDRRSSAILLARLARALPGVVDVTDKLRWEFDDAGTMEPHWYRGHPFNGEPRGVDEPHGVQQR
jgi:CBS-domain-containing membrane protein